jgi:2-C-methyl-D-erythritol 4-phosphate cytidylyltransferase/2-C-methyl-D-erythritol 2,4-cyclodiphosphate synthase
LALAEQFLRPALYCTTGLGFDVHAFDSAPAESVRLCGVDVPHSHKLKGHSDADVGLHALTDAILGAIGEGDIGRHFPPSDATLKNMDSAVFLEHAVKLMQGKNGALNNIDLTLICEEPKITPHAPAMRDRIAAITGVWPERINIKATTTEQLGFTGRKEGIAAQAIVSISLPYGS